MADRKLSDVKKVTALVNEFKKKDKPTLAGLARALSIHPDTLYRNIDREDKIGELLLDTYLWMVEKHEEALWDSKNYVAHIFWLKCLKKHITFKENKDIDTQDKIHLTYEIVERTSK